MARFFVLALLLAAANAGAVMDCSRTKSNAEKMICSNSRLMQADQQLALAWREAIRRGIDPQELMETQRTWLRDVRDACNDVECMLRAYQDRVADLENRR
jgi:uncharacterized protein